MKDKPDIFKFFEKMNRGEYSFVDAMSDDDIKSMAPYVVLCWCHGAQGNAKSGHVILTDTYCNPVVFSLYKHPRLLLKLFVFANSGFGATRYKFVKSSNSDDVKLYGMIASYYGCGMREAKEILPMLSDDDIAQLKEYYKET